MGLSTSGRLESWVLLVVERRIFFCMFGTTVKAINEMIAANHPKTE
jgi:hypothetical protein